MTDAPNRISLLPPANLPLTGAEMVPMVKDDELVIAPITSIIGNVSVTLAALTMRLDALEFALGSAPPAVPLASVDVLGWTGDYTIAPPEFAPDSNPVTFPVSRKGFDRQGNATVHNDKITITRRRGDIAPNQDQDTEFGVAFDEWLLATDTVFGFENNSVLVSEKPTVRWAMVDQIVIGNSLYWEVVVFHHGARDGQMVPCVKVRATDGGNGIVEEISNDPQPSTWGKDAVPCTVFSGTLDITDLDGPLITLNGRAFPWLGDDASVIDSADSDDIKAFSPRYYRKDVERFNNPPLAYINSALPNDDAGMWSTDATVAQMARFKTVEGALLAIDDQANLAATGGISDGCIIRANAGNHELTAPNGATSIHQQIAALTLTRDPNVPRSDVAYDFGGENFRPRLGTGDSLTTPSGEAILRIADVGLRRIGNSNFGQYNEAGGGPVRPMRLWLDDVDFDNANYDGAIISGANSCYITGMNITGHSGSSAILGIPGNSEMRLLRGISGDLAGATYDGWCAIGNAFTRPGNFTLRDETQGCVVYCNPLRECDGPTLSLTGAGLIDEVVTGVAIVQNMLEYTGTNSGAAVQVCSNGGNSRGAVVVHNTATGFSEFGRWNLLYSGFSSPGKVNQTHVLHLIMGNIMGQLNVKNHRFGPFDPSHIGNMALDHGVGCTGNVSLFAANVIETEHPLFAGLGSVLHDDDEVMADIRFVNFKGTTGANGDAIAGAGGSDLHLQAGSVARATVHKKVISHDLDGTALPDNGPWDAGCFAGDVAA